MTPPTAAARLRFGRFELLPQECRLLVDGEPVVLGGRAFDLLRALAERPGRLVGKGELMDLVWPGLVVQENNLAAQMSALRKVLGDQLIATIPGRGYRFIAPIESVVPPDPAGAPAERHAALAPRSNLPSELPILLGRGDDLAALGQLVDAHRLVNVVGPGGIGKSLLAQHLLAARRGAYPQGVCWVELAPVTDGAALAGAVAAALDVEVGHGEPVAALAGAVEPLSMLLALDNAEHLLADVALLCRTLHAAAPHLRILVTSQVPLRLAAERVHRLGPLAVPTVPLPPTQALQFGAVALFVERAQAVDARLTLTEANTATVIDICRTLDGLPLAIELASARATLGVQQLLSSLSDRLKLLTSSRNRAAPTRQRTLRAALEWSHGFLDARERTVFRRLGVIAGSASLELIQQVVADTDGGSDLDPWAVLDALDALIDRSLVVVLSGPGSGAPRYRLLESPRAFALECLAAAGERQALQRRHALAVTTMLDAAYEEYFSGRVGTDEWLRQREADLDNARDALRWARTTGETEVELRIGTTMLRALQHSLHAQMIELADACEACLDADLPEALRQRAWIELACVLSDPRKQRGRRAADQALYLARRLDASQPDRFVLYHALARAASAAAQDNDLARARTLLAEAEALADPAWPAQRLVWGEEAAQWVARMSGDNAAALVRGRRLLALDLERGSNAAIAAGNLIDAELAAGDAQGAARAGAALIESLKGTRHEHSMAFARINLLAALLAMDDCAQAREIARAAWGQAPGFDLQHAATAYLALLAALEDRPRAAARLTGYSDALYAARQEVHELNEARAKDRARGIAIRSLGDAEFHRLHDQGTRMRDAEVPAQAFAGADTAP